MNLEKMIQNYKTETKVIPREEKILETIQKSKEVMMEVQSEHTMSYGEFLFSQFRLIRKRWWMLQAALLIVTFFLMNYLDDSEYLMRTLGTSSVLFIVMIIPEFWRNKESDVTKMMEISEKAFCKKYSDKIVEIPGCRKCIAETDFNLLISDDKELFKKMGMLEVTKVETLRSEITSIISFQPLKFMMAKEYLNMMKIKTGCKSEQQYVEKYEIPKEFDEALQRFMNSHHDNSYYKSMINYLKNKECFDLDKIRELGLDIQYLSSITSDGSMTLEVFVVGKGIFYSVLEDDEGEQWNEIHIDEMGNIKLPYFSYYSDRVEERIINLSHTEVDRDFSKYNTVENIQWCIQNLNMKGIEDYEFDVLGYHSDAIDLRIHTDLLVKMIVPDAIDTIFTDQIIDLEKLVWITDVSDMRVFAQDI